MTPASKLKCPTCGQRGDWFAGPYGPFCSRRCKLVDLGKWFGEEHVISAPLRPEHLEPEDASDDGGAGEHKDTDAHHEHEKHLPLPPTGGGGQTPGRSH